MIISRSAVVFKVNQSLSPDNNCFNKASVSVEPDLMKLSGQMGQVTLTPELFQVDIKPGILNNTQQHRCGAGRQPNVSEQPEKTKSIKYHSDSCQCTALAV